MSVSPPPQAIDEQLLNEKFWQSVRRFRGRLALAVFWEISTFGLFAALCMLGNVLWPFVGLEVGPVEMAGGALGLLLVLRTNAGYDRWWEARCLWGTLVNDTRSLTSMGLLYVQADKAWHARFAQLCAVFPLAMLQALRRAPDAAGLAKLLPAEEAEALVQAHHMPTTLSLQLGELLQQAHAKGQLNGIMLHHMEGCRTRIMGYVGGCERVRDTPLPYVYVVKIRRFVAIYLLLVPFALVDKVGWATPILTMLVAYPALGMDHIAQHLQMPFALRTLTALPLDRICANIAANVAAQMEQRYPSSSQ